jgi:AcrR family transcriptional regulator
VARVGHREALLEGAIRCLQEKGYARTTARDLVAASGANLASIGYHYGSKERLLNLALIESFRRWLYPLLTPAIAAGPETAWERLRNGLIQFLGSLETNRPLVVAFAEAIAQTERSDEVRTQMAFFYDETRGAIAAAAAEAFGESGRDREVDFRTVAAMIIAMFDGLMIQFLIDPEHFLDLTQLATSAQALLDLLEAAPVVHRQRPRPRPA